MKIHKEFSKRRRSNATDLKETDEKLFRTVDHHYQTEMHTLTSHFEKVAFYINDVFCALANHDVRFEFDPLSLDDCRCEIVSASEINLICELKHLPDCSYEVHGNGSNGAVRIRLADGYCGSYEHASWDDVCSRHSNRDGGNFLNTRALLDVFTTSLGRAVSDVWNEHRNVGLVYRVSGNLASIYVDIPDEGFFTVTLIPALKLKKCRVSGLGARSDEYFQTLGVPDDFFTSVYAVVKPSHSAVDEFWRLTFNNLENRVLHSERFTCGRHCLHALRHLLNSPKSPRCNIAPLSSYQLQLVTIKEYAKHPNGKDWAPAKFHKRLIGMMTSLKSCLKEGLCENPFTGTNVFSDFDEKSLKVLAKDVEHVTKSSERLLCNL